MLEILQCADKSVTVSAFESANIIYCDGCGMLQAKDKDEVLGYSLYCLENDKITIFKIEPQNDIMLFDGILRSTLHIAASRSIMNAFFSEDFCYIDNLKILGFVKQFLSFVNFIH